MQKHVHLGDFVKSFPTNIYLRKSASIQPSYGLLKFGAALTRRFHSINRLLLVGVVPVDAAIKTLEVEKPFTLET